jgi:Zn-dependent protease
VLHEMAHKFTAMRFGFWAEFQKNTQMLLIAVVLAALAGIVFAAPGATVIYGSMSREQNGKISIAGPLTNLILCIPFGLIYLGGVMGSLGLIGLIIGSVGLQVNAMIAFFNMLPVSVLDGRKILSWNLPVFVIMFLATLGVLYLSLTSLYITGISL